MGIYFVENSPSPLVIIIVYLALTDLGRFHIFESYFIFFYRFCIDALLLFKKLKLSKIHFFWLIHIVWCMLMRCALRAGLGVVFNVGFPFRSIYYFLRRTTGYVRTNQNCQIQKMHLDSPGSFKPYLSLKNWSQVYKTSLRTIKDLIRCNSWGLGSKPTKLFLVLKEMST